MLAVRKENHRTERVGWVAIEAMGMRMFLIAESFVNLFVGGRHLGDDSEFLVVKSTCER